MNIRANEDRPPLMLVSPITTPNYRTKTKKRRESTICFQYPSGYPPSFELCATGSWGFISYENKKVKESIHQVKSSSRY